MNTLMAYYSLSTIMTRHLSLSLSLGGVTSSLSRVWHILSLSGCHIHSHSGVAHPLSLGGCTSSLSWGWNILSHLGVAHTLPLGGGTSSLSRGWHILSLSGVAHPLSLEGGTSSLSWGWHIISLSRGVAHHPHCGCCRPQLQNRQQ